jgi:hypothetical protein
VLVTEDFSCLMYFDDLEPTAVQQYVLGNIHTPSMITDANNNTLIDQRILLLDNYRKGEMNTALDNVDQAELPFGLSPHEVESFVTKLIRARLDGKLSSKKLKPPLEFWVPYSEPREMLNTFHL